MTQTLRREIIQTVFGVLQNYYDDVQNKDIAKIIADELIELRAFKFEPKTIEQAIIMDVPVTDQIAADAKLKDVAPKMFEKALGFSKPLPWWSNKTWTAFAEWVCDRYAESKTSFGEYNIWRNTPYTKGGIANTRLRGFPAEFYDSWDMFKMSQAPKKDEARPEYQPVKRDETEAVPNPMRKPRLT